MKERQLLLTNMQRAESAVIGEHAITLTLALARNLQSHVLNQQQGNGSDVPKAVPCVRSTQTLLVVDWVASAPKSLFGHACMKVTATQQRQRPHWTCVSSAMSGCLTRLLTLAKDADVVVNAAPLTAATTGIFDAKFSRAQAQCLLR
jgi:lactate dehydrogenase-like 2-hydroxyacid dehydrogenase